MYIYIYIYIHIYIFIYIYIYTYIHIHICMRISHIFERFYRVSLWKCHGILVSYIYQYNHRDIYIYIYICIYTYIHIHVNIAHTREIPEGIVILVSGRRTCWIEDITRAIAADSYVILLHTYVHKYRHIYMCVDKDTYIHIYNIHIQILP